MTKVKHPPEYVRDISEAVYRVRLGEDDTARMIAVDGAEKLRKRAACYDILTRVYLDVIAKAEGAS